jgi:hypothetical protein
LKSGLAWAGEVEGVEVHFVWVGSVIVDFFYAWVRHDVLCESSCSVVLYVQ